MTFCWRLSFFVVGLQSLVVPTTSVYPYEDAYEEFVAQQGLLSVDESTTDDLSSCGVYLAPSTIPHAGLGIFAGKAYSKKWEPIGPPDIVIPILDYYRHNPNEEAIIFDLYGWNTHTFRHADLEGLESETINFCPGSGAALNCILSLVNTVGMDNYIRYSTEGLHRSKDPGTGAFTPFYNRQLVSRGGIEAGTELFDGYGEPYFADREPTFGQIPLNEQHHSAADNLLNQYVHLKNSLTDHQRAAMQQQRNEQPSPAGGLHEDWYLLMRKLTNVWPSRVLNAWPEDPEKVDYIAEIGTAYTHYDRSKRSIEWLDANGACMDNIEGRTSTIKQAGRGAFARRFIPKGGIVAPAPSIHMPRHILDMYPIEYDEYGIMYFDTSGEPIHYQLMLNYCFGHRNSSVLVCPYGAISSLINHSKEKANAKIVWNTNGMMQHPEWLEQPPEKWLGEMHAGLMLDFVATRDIQPDEEVFIYYGDEWQAAWDKHVAEWKPPQNAQEYRSAEQLDREETVLKTMAEGGYSTNDAKLVCRDEYRAFHGLTIYDDGETTYGCQIVERFEETNERGETEYFYTAEVLADNTIEGGGVDYEGPGYCTSEVADVLFKVPRDAFTFEDQPYSRDHSQSWSFRHDLRIPDEIMPQAWLDL